MSSVIVFARAGADSCGSPGVVSGARAAHLSGLVNRQIERRTLEAELRDLGAVSHVAVRLSVRDSMRAGGLRLDRVAESGVVSRPLTAPMIMAVVRP